MTTDAHIDACHSGPGRPRGFDASAALAAAMEVFWRQGYEATSLDDLTAAMGLSRSSLYGCFGCKREVLLAALRDYTARNMAKFAEIAQAGQSPRDAARAMIEAIADAKGGPSGCLVVNCITELAPHDSEIRALTHGHIAAVESLIAGAIARTAPEGARDRARALISLAVGAVTLRKAGFPPEAIESALAEAERLLPPET